MEIHIRRAIKDDIPGIAKVHADSWKTYKGIFPNEILENITYEKQEKQWENIFQKESNHQFRFVAETLNGEIVGFIDGGVERTGTYNWEGIICDLPFTRVSRNENRTKVISSFLIGL